jgi:hypothetical protein
MFAVLAGLFKTECIKNGFTVSCNRITSAISDLSIKSAITLTGLNDLLEGLKSHALLTMNFHDEQCQLTGFANGVQIGTRTIFTGLPPYIDAIHDSRRNSVPGFSSYIIGMENMIGQPTALTGFKPIPIGGAGDSDRIGQTMLANAGRNFDQFEPAGLAPRVPPRTRVRSPQSPVPVFLIDTCPGLR